MPQQSHTTPTALHRSDIRVLLGPYSTVGLLSSSGNRVTREGASTDHYRVNNISTTPKTVGSEVKHLMSGRTSKIKTTVGHDQVFKNFKSQVLLTTHVVCSPTYVLGTQDINHQSNFPKSGQFPKTLDIPRW